MKSRDTIAIILIFFLILLSLIAILAYFYRDQIRNSLQQMGLDPDLDIIESDESEMAEV